MSWLRPWPSLSLLLLLHRGAPVEPSVPSSEPIPAEESILADRAVSSECSYSC